MAHERAACYCLTRNLYPQLVPSLRSLLANGRPDVVYVLAEDDALPYPVPETVRVINVSGQGWFRHDGPNYRNHWTWMVLMRGALPQVLKDEDRVLSLDVDTLILGSLDELWGLDLGGAYLAGAREPQWTGTLGRLYVNFGVILFNLAKLREDGTDLRIIRTLDTRASILPEQHTVNEICAGHILEISGRFNANPYTVPFRGGPVIRHFAAEQRWFDRPEVRAWCGPVE